MPFLKDEKMPSLTPEQKEPAAPVDTPRDVTAHLSRAALLRLLGAALDGLPETVLPHLIECPECRTALRQALRRADVPVDHPAHAVLEDAEVGARWAAAGEAAAASACRELAAQGIGYVYGRDGRVYRRLPDGEEERVPVPEPLPA